MARAEERRRRRRLAVIATVLSVALGVGAATSAVVTVLSLEKPDDQGALLRGPSEPVDPGSVIPYGG